MRQTQTAQPLRAGIVGIGMIFDETYRPFFEGTARGGLFCRDFGLVEPTLFAVASRTGIRAERYRAEAPAPLAQFKSFAGPESIMDLVAEDLHAVCIATPDDRHYQPARAALAAARHVLIEKPSVLSLAELDDLTTLALQNDVMAKVVYHKLADPDHKKLRGYVTDGTLKHINNGYCSLLEPKSISGGQFAEWIAGRNPATYVGVHYLKLIDFTFGQDWRLSRVSATGQRGIVGSSNSSTWDSVQLQVVYTHPDNREAAFDIHTSWVTPDNFPGYVEQEVQFRFDNGVWNAHQRKRGVEVTVENRSPGEVKYTPNHHYSAKFLEPWGERSQRGYGIEAIRRFFEEVAYVEFGGTTEHRGKRLGEMRSLAYNDLNHDRNCVAIVQAVEAILAAHASGRPGGQVTVNGSHGGLVLFTPGVAEPTVLYNNKV